VVAHRGASAHQPENTLAAFEAAVAAGADIVELDVRRSADGALVVRHDPTVGPANVAEVTLAEIEAMQPEIPTLDAVLELLRGRVALEVEIKNVPGEAGYEPSGSTIAGDVVGALRRHAFAAAFVASFDPDCLHSVGEIDPELATGLLVEPPGDLDQALELAAGRHAFLLPEATALEAAGPAFIDRAHERDLYLCAWTVDDPDALERLFELGVDAVETNDPALGVRVRDSLGRA
jgi:glycerophosphoryl diester phosphodiesterase